MADDNDNFVTRGFKQMTDYAVGKAKDLAARGAVITTTGPGNGFSKPASIDVGKLAEDQARSMGRGDAMAGTAPKKKKPAAPMHARMASAMEDQ